jgi:hypothetical protein
VAYSIYSRRTRFTTTRGGSGIDSHCFFVVYLAMALEDSTLYEWTIKWIGREELSF